MISPDDYLADSDIQRRDYYAKRPRLGEIYKGYWGALPQQQRYGF